MFIKNSKADCYFYFQEFFGFSFSYSVGQGGGTGLYEDMLTVSTRGGPVQKFPKALSTGWY